MSSFWSKISEESDGSATEEDLESAAYKLMMEQVIYYSDRGSRGLYYLVERYEREFAKVLEPFGVELKINKIHRYAVAIPNHDKTSPTSKFETLVALVMRGIYEESLRSSNIYLSQAGEVYCSVQDLADKYQLMTGDEMPQGKGNFDNLMRTLARWGIARYLSEDEIELDGYVENQNAIAIRPAIIDVLGEYALLKLASWQSINSATTQSGTYIQNGQLPGGVND